MAYRLGVDVGGTFTDLFLVGDSNGGAQFRVKTPSTPADPSQGVLNGVRRICDEAGIDVGDLRNILHGTTVATNAVLESKGARVGLITTTGFKQILHLARSQTPGPLAGWIIMIKPDPPASLADTREAIDGGAGRPAGVLLPGCEQGLGPVQVEVGVGQRCRRASSHCRLGLEPMIGRKHRVHPPIRAPESTASPART